MDTGALDRSGAEGFAERMVRMLNDGMLCLMVSIGHRAGLFDAMGDGEPRTSPQLADHAGLRERYVREWLGAMVTGGLVDHDQGSGTYRLPAERARFLTRAAGLDNLAIEAQYIALLGNVEERIVACFRHGGGVPYSEFTDFQRLMAEDSAATFDAKLLAVTLPLVDGLGP